MIINVLSMNKDVAQLKAYILYMLMLPEWPSKDFGNFVDHFASFAGYDWESGSYSWYRQETTLDHMGSFGIDKITFNAMARSLFDTDDFEPEIRVWWYPLWKRLNLTNAAMTQIENEHTHVYPLPSWLANLIMPGNITEDQRFLAHPAFIQELSIEQILKMVKFEIWAKYQVNTKKFATLTDVLRRELQVFEENGFALREDFQAYILEIM